MDPQAQKSVEDSWKLCKKPKRLKLMSDFLIVPLEQRWFAMGTGISGSIWKNRIHFYPEFDPERNATCDFLDSS